MWGVIHAQKKYPTTARSMALECGSVMHEVFGAARVWQLSCVQELDRHAQATGERLFTKKRWRPCWKAAEAHDDPRESLLELCFAVLHSSGYQDDSNDRNRTMTNMELAAIEYVNEILPRMENWPIYVEDEKNPQSMVGIEQVFDVVLLFEDGKEIRHIGTIDGLVRGGSKNEYHLDENKTAARLSEGWRASFDLKHQVTAYCAASTAVFGFRTMKARVIGLKIPPSHKGGDCDVVFPIERTEDMFQHWADWVREGVEVFESHKGSDFERATRRTHSCNRFFRSCSLLPFCCDTAQGRQLAYRDLMVPVDPSPSERAIQEMM